MKSSRMLAAIAAFALLANALGVARSAETPSDAKHLLRYKFALGEVLPAPWMALLERNRMPVVESFLRWRCETRDGVSAVRFHNECTDPAGGALPSVDRAIDCESGEIDEGAE